MPSQVRATPSEQHHDKHHDKLHDPHHRDPAKNWVQKEALRVAIGSILAPKRPPIPPNSHSTSGTTSPAYSFPTSVTGTPGTGTPTHPFSPGDYLHPHHHHYAFLQPHHTPSRLARSVSHSPDHSPTSTPARDSSPPAKPSAAPTSAEPDKLRLPPPVIVEPVGSDPTHAQQKGRPSATPLQPANGEKSKTHPANIPTVPNEEFPHGPANQSSGRKTPRAKFLETLQGKSAWDALIHGSFS